MPDSEQPEMSEEGKPQKVTLTQRDLREAARLFRLLSDSARGEEALPARFPRPGEEVGDLSSRQLLALRARAVLDSRRARRRYFQADLFGEPAWEILLALFIDDESSARLSISRLAQQIETPLTTVVRWVNALEKAGLVSRDDHPTDRRTMFIRLSDKGRTALESYLAVLPA